MFAPTVNVPFPKVILPPVAPPPDNAPIRLLNPFRSSVTPARFDKVTEELLPNAFVDPARRTPPPTTVVPV